MDKDSINKKIEDNIKICEEWLNSEEKCGKNSILSKAVFALSENIRLLEKLKTNEDLSGDLS